MLDILNQEDSRLRNEWLIKCLIGKFRGKKNVNISSKVSAKYVLLNILKKGFGSYFRGLLLKPFLGKSRGALFIGQGCSIINKKLLRVGRNFYLGSYCYLDCLSVEGVNIGNGVTIREGSWLQVTSRYDTPGLGITIGDNVYIGPRATLGAAAKIIIGDRCQFGANVSLVAENHEFSGEGEIFNQGVTRLGITVGKDVWIGNNVTILDGVLVGDGAVLGAGTVVTKSVPSRAIVVGVPGKVMRYR